MPETVFPIIRETRLGSSPPGTTMQFTIPRNGGYVAEATLFCGSKVVASWESVEILGKTTEEILRPVGLYTLQIDIVFNKPDAADVTLEFSTLADGEVLKRRKLSFSGKRPDIARALALTRIERP